VHEGAGIGTELIESMRLGAFAYSQALEIDPSLSELPSNLATIDQDPEVSGCDSHGFNSAAVDRTGDGRSMELSSLAPALRALDTTIQVCTSVAQHSSSLSNSRDIELLLQLSCSCSQRCKLRFSGFIS
jgi:hypothetical protein